MAIIDSIPRYSGNQIPDLPLLIERMQESDLPQVLSIEHECFSMPWSRQMFESELRETIISYPLVVRWLDKMDLSINPRIDNINAPICGYCVFWYVPEEIHLGNIAVASQYRRQGIASVMLRNIIQLSEKWQVKRITLEVRMSNQHAIHLYHNFGFKNVAIRRKYYNNPLEDALVMIKDNINCSEYR